MAMTKVISIKVPDDMAVLQSRLTATAKRAQIPVWELLTRMLDKWDESGSGEPAGESWTEWKAAIEEKVRRLETELEAAKSQIDSGLLINKVDQNSLPAEAEPVNAKENQERNSLLVTQVVDVSDIEAFRAAYKKLERVHHARICDIRVALGWPSEKFDAMLRQVRDNEEYQLVEGGETGDMTDEQIVASFVDENGRRHLNIMKIPAPDEIELKPQRKKKKVEPTTPPVPQKRGRPPKTPKGA